MQTAVVYTRESSQATLPTDVKHANQEDDCRRWAQEHGFSVYKVYRESHSGADLLNRPLIWEVIDDVRNGMADTVLVRNYDRLARKPEHQAVILYEVEEKNKGQVISVLEPIDSDDIASRTTRAILAVVAEAERLNSQARMLRGLRRRAERGELMVAGSPLFGYAWLDDEPNKRTTYVIDPVSGPIVQRLFQLVIQGQSLRKIADKFTAENLPTPSQLNQMRGRGGRRPVAPEWKATLLSRILADVTYTGNATAYRWQKNGKYSNKHKARPLDDPARIQQTVPALIDQATYDAAQSALKAKVATGRPPLDAEAVWLRGHVYCAVCHSRMVLGRTSDGRYQYRCWRRRGDAGGCPAGDLCISTRMLDKPAYGALHELLSNKERAMELMVQRLGTGRLGVLASVAESYQSQIQDKQQELDQTLKLARQTTNQDIAGRLLHDAEEISTSIHTLELEYTGAREELDDLNADRAWVQGVLDTLQADGEVETRTLAERRLLLAASGLRAEVYPAKSTRDTARVEVVFDWQVSANRRGSLRRLCRSG